MKGQIVNETKFSGSPVCTGINRSDKVVIAAIIGMVLVAFTWQPVY